MATMVIIMMQTSSSQVTIYWKLGIDERNFLIIIFDPESRILKEPVIELDCLTAGPAQKP